MKLSHVYYYNICLIIMNCNLNKLFNVLLSTSDYFIQYIFCKNNSNVFFEAIFFSTAVIFDNKCFLFQRTLLISIFIQIEFNSIL